jgi:hypothetical protein
MSELEKKLSEKIRNAPRQSKPKEASLAVYDCNGRWLFEVYGGRGPFRTRVEAHVQACPIDKSRNISR